METEPSAIGSVFLFLFSRLGRTGCYRFFFYPVSLVSNGSFLLPSFDTRMRLMCVLVCAPLCLCVCVCVFRLAARPLVGRRVRRANGEAESAASFSCPADAKECGRVRFSFARLPLDVDVPDEFLLYIVLGFIVFFPAPTRCGCDCVCVCVCVFVCARSLIGAPVDIVLVPRFGFCDWAAGTMAAAG